MVRILARYVLNAATQSLVNPLSSNCVQSVALKREEAVAKTSNYISGGIKRFIFL